MPCRPLTHMWVFKERWPKQGKWLAALVSKVQGSKFWSKNNIYFSLTRHVVFLLLSSPFASILLYFSFFSLPFCFPFLFFFPLSSFFFPLFCFLLLNFPPFSVPLFIISPKWHQGYFPLYRPLIKYIFPPWQWHEMVAINRINLLKEILNCIIRD